MLFGLEVARPHRGSRPLDPVDHHGSIRRLALAPRLLVRRCSKLVLVLFNRSIFSPCTQHDGTLLARLIYMVV